MSFYLHMAGNEIFDLSRYVSLKLIVKGETAYIAGMPPIGVSNDPEIVAVFVSGPDTISKAQLAWDNIWWALYEGRPGHSIVDLSDPKTPDTLRLLGVELIGDQERPGA